MDIQESAAAAAKRRLLACAFCLVAIIIATGAGFHFYGFDGSTPAARAQATCSEHSARYVIRPLGQNRFEVELTLGQPAQQLDIVSRQDANRNVSTDDFIEKVRHRRADGSEVALEHAGQGTWQMVGSSQARPVVIYEINADHDQYPWRIGKEEVAYNFDGSSFFTGWTVLLADYQQFSCASEVSFDIPDDWSVAAPWSEIGPNQFRADNIQDLHKNGFALGPSMPTFTLQAGASKLTIVYENTVREIAEQTSRDADAVFNYYQDTYGGPAGANYTIFMVSDNQSDGGAFERSFAQRFALPGNKAEEMVWRHGFAHEVGHLWNGITIAPERADTNEWFKEGFTDYLTLKALLKIGALTPSQLENKLENIIRRYYLSLSANGPMSLVEAGANKQENRMLVYGGGALVALLLDGEMSASFGVGSFEALLAGLYEGREQRFSLERLTSVMDSRSDGKASALLAAVNDGLMPGDLKARLARQGIDLGVFAPEELYVRFSPSTCGPDHSACMPEYFAQVYQQ